MKNVAAQSSLFTLLIAAVCVFFLTPLKGRSQTTTGSIYGKVADASGALIPGAAVTANNVETGRILTTTSDRSGDYIFESLTPGNYSVETKVTGFQSVVQNDIRLSANQNVQVIFALHAGSIDQKIDVNATTTLVDTRDSQIGETIDEKRIQDLPLNGRNAYDLVQTVPGVTNYTQDSPIGTREGSSLSVNGLPNDTNSYYLDGAFDTGIYHLGGNLIPNPDALQEFRILVGNYDAEFGHSPGSAINLLTRSGTNRFHGLIYEYLRNDALNAKSYFQTGRVAPLKQNQFGGNFGGPLMRDKLFFFGAYEGLRIHSPAVVTSVSILTPTAAERMGDFTADPTPPAKLACGSVKYKICPNLLDPIAQAILKYVPVSTIANGFHPDQQSVPADTESNQYIAKIDDQLTSTQHASLLYFTARGSNTTPDIGNNQILGYAGMINHENQTNAVLTHNWILSPKAVNDARAFYTLNRYVIANLYGSAHAWAEFGSTVAEGGAIIRPPQFAITGYWTMGSSGSGPSDITQQSLGFVDTFNYDFKHHAIKAGGSVIWNKYNETGALTGSGNLKFNGSITGNALVDFLEGKANAFSQSSNIKHRLHQVNPALYAQDNWRASERLTFNLGLRWEVYPPFTGENNLSTFEPNVQSQRFPTAPLGLVTAGDPGVPQGIRDTTWDAFSPRVGFAYDLLGDGTTSVRGAYGIFYAAVEETDSSGLEQQPYTLNITLNNTPNLVAPYAPNVDPFPYNSNSQNPVFTSGASITGLPPHEHSVPYVQEFNLTLERQLSTNWSARLSYVGNTSRKFYINVDVNAPIYSPNGATSTNGLNSRRPYQPTPKTFTFGAISIEDPLSSGSYNALQAVITKRFSHNFSFHASYVWSKNLDIRQALVNQYDVSLNRGPSINSTPQRFVASYIYSLPSLKRWGAVGREVLGGWQINGITTISDGTPYGLLSNVDSNKDGFASDRPDIVGNPSLGGGRSRAQKIKEYFNKAAYQVPADNVPYGNVGRNTLLGPGFINTDLSAFKSFSIWKESSLQFRGEVFNVFNNVNLDAPNSTLGTASYGTITSTVGNPRIVQFALRLKF